jgi:hypothetical protein
MAKTRCACPAQTARTPSTTLAEFHQAAIDSGAAQPAFFLARHLAELTLKAWHLPDFPVGHNLTTLPDSLGQCGDELVDGGAEQNMNVRFVDDLARARRS